MAYKDKRNRVSDNFVEFLKMIQEDISLGVDVVDGRILDLVSDLRAGKSVRNVPENIESIDLGDNKTLGHYLRDYDIQHPPRAELNERSATQLFNMAVQDAKRNEGVKQEMRRSNSDIFSNSSRRSSIDSAQINTAPASNSKDTFLDDTIEDNHLDEAYVMEEKLEEKIPSPPLASVLKAANIFKKNAKAEVQEEQPKKTGGLVSFLRRKFEVSSEDTSVDGKHSVRSELPPTQEKRNQLGDKYRDSIIKQHDELNGSKDERLGKELSELTEHHHVTDRLNNIRKVDPFEVRRIKVVEIGNKSASLEENMKNHTMDVDDNKWQGIVSNRAQQQDIQPRR